MASAAASFMGSVIWAARTSRAPRNTPGKASTLLIWLGKSLRPVATTRACARATSRLVSGCRLGKREHAGVSAHGGDRGLGPGGAGQADEHVGAVQGGLGRAGQP